MGDDGVMTFPACRVPWCTLNAIIELAPPMCSVLVPFQLLSSRISALPEERVALHAMVARPAVPRSSQPAAPAATNAGGAPAPSSSASAAAAALPPSALAVASAAEAEGLSVRADLGALGSTVRRLRKLLDQVLAYVDDVVVSMGEWLDGVHLASAVCCV
jgi:hypothetical protein